MTLTGQTCGGKMMDLGGKTSLGWKRHKFGMTIGMNHGTVHGMRDRNTGMSPGAGRQQMTSKRVQVPVQQLREYSLSC